MVGHYVGPDVTSASSNVPQHHLNNVAWGQYTLSGGTASGSTTIAIMRIPPGARITGAVLQWNNSDLSTTTGASLCVRGWTNGAAGAVGEIIKTTAISTQPQFFSPSYTQLGYRYTASSMAVISLHDFVGTGTASTQFTLQLMYNCTLTGD